MRSIQGIAFDFGNTLFSTEQMGVTTDEMKELFVAEVERDWTVSRVKAMEILERYMMAYRERKRINQARPERETSALSCLERALGDGALEVDLAKGRKLLDLFHGREAMRFTPIEGAPELIKKLKENGLRLAVLSNNPWTEAIRVALSAQGLLPHFELVSSSSDLGWRKPSRKVFELFLERWGLSAESVIYVGDSFHHDIEVPKAMGFSTCLVNIGGADLNKQSHYRHFADQYLESFADFSTETASADAFP